MATSPQANEESRSGLEPWRKADLPEPPPSHGLRIFGVIGPGAILLGGSIGSGEWLLGPAAFVKHGLALLWVTTVAVVLQTIFNTELIRYTLYTGEPAVTGFMRTRPHPTFWAWWYSALAFLQVGWPAWAGSAAGAIFFLWSGRLATLEDADLVYAIGVAAFLACALVLVFGGRRIERTLEVLNWILIVFILGTLLVLCVLYASREKWAATAAGFFGFDTGSRRFLFLPEGADWFLIGAFAAYSGMGGIGNLSVSNYARDKGYGMGKVVGFIPAAVGGHRVNLAHSGTVFEPSSPNLLRWRRWWRIVRVDQWGVFFAGAILGMALPAMLYTSTLTPGTEIRGLAIAAELAHGMSRHGGPWLTLLLAFLSAWVLFKTQLDLMEGMTRSVTDILWSGSPRCRAWSKGDVRRIYYSVLAALVSFGLIALRLTHPIILLQLGANMAGVIFVFAAPHILYVNTRLLPKELRPPLWRRLALLAMALFYGFFVYLWLLGGLVPDPAKGFLFNISKHLGF